MTTATKPGAPFQGPSWAEAIKDPSTLRHSPIQRTGKKFAEDQPRDDHGRFAGTAGEEAPFADQFNAGTSTPKQAFDQCWDVANEYADFLTLEHDIPARVVQWAGSPDYPHPYERWNEVPPENRIHYVVATEDKYVDWAARQFDPNAPYPAVYTSREEAGWQREYELPSGQKDFSEELHPRDDHGRFTDTGSLGDTAIQQGGFSLSLAGDKPSSGWMVSKFDSERSFSIEQLAGGQDMSFVPGNPWHDNFTHEVDRFVQDKLPDLQKPGAYLGGWVDSGRLFLDVSYNFQDEAEARQFAQDNRQFAMFNAGTGEYVEFQQDRRAAAREAADQKAKEQAKEREKVLLKVGKDDTAESIAEKLHRALFG